MFLLLSTDTPVEFLAKLTEQYVEEDHECVFTCVVDREDVTVDWFHNDTPLLPSDKHVIKDEKKTHSLVIKNSDYSDIGDYTVVVGDSRSSAKLHLSGKFYNNLQLYSLYPQYTKFLLHFICILVSELGQTEMLVLNCF